MSEEPNEEDDVLSARSESRLRFWGGLSKLLGLIAALIVLHFFVLPIATIALEEYTDLLDDGPAATAIDLIQHPNYAAYDHLEFYERYIDFRLDQMSK